MDEGSWSYPRYRIAFDQIDFSVPGRYVYKFTGQPAVPLTLTFKLTDENQLKLLRDNSTCVDATLRTVDGRLNVQATDEISNWKLANSNTIAELWHPQLRDVTIPQSKDVSLIIVVTNANSIAPHVFARASLSGGGNEL